MKLPSQKRFFEWQKNKPYSKKGYTFLEQDYIKQITLNIMKKKGCIDCPNTKHHCLPL
ncbi:hypothetical protein DF16_orf01984 [Bacillus thuringiensis serovar kurstaki str. YBT-1520]|nr:hypothetical protein HD73_4246 [Bacillus thuringiensis serovar kurstaki str. HD73]AIM30399.1 hypothetical protein DF16_orf01984 [Bacillus thuringiensis serovar kurstaki str. YBT-1520]AVR33877.1 Arginine decarboxylase [Bacillus cereus]EEL63586.1 hypothetical protein bcere0025_36330 [Bacillus cereus F65185]KEH49056.1 Arginine decarboxylase [Bacillus thuringiensis serovar kurstaki str. HD-1]CCW08808.1 Arginine decarboxylase [Bacillus sp. GeD10]